MEGKKRFHWEILPFLLFGLFAGLMSISIPVNATGIDQVEMKNDAWAPGYLDSVTADPFTQGGRLNYGLSGTTQGRTNAICALDPTGVISRWPLNEADGATTFVDKVGAHNGSCDVETCPSATEGIIQGAFRFTATSMQVWDEIRVPASTDFDWDTSDSFSIGVWVKTTQDCSGNKVFLGRYQPNEGTWWVGCTPDQTNPEIGLPAFRLRDSSRIPRQVNGITRINDGRWHFIVGVRDGKNDENRIFVDGKLEDMAGAREYIGDFVNTQDVTIGGYDEPRDYFFDGKLDEIFIYNRALTANEILKYYYACDPPEIYLPVIIK